MFTVGVSADHYLITYCVAVMYSFGVFTLVVLKDELLLPFLYVLPVCLEGDVEERVTSKHYLCRRGTQGGVHR